MNEADLNRMLQRAATAPTAGVPRALEETIMSRVRTDEGRAKRWRSFVHWLLILAGISGVGVAGVVGWSLASRDKTHITPPVMELFRTGAAR